VHFSQGNLQYQASTDTWRFAEKQYDFIGDANKNFSYSYTGWIDLMGFGTTGIYCNPYDFEYHIPEYISADNIDNINGTLADWGVACEISNGGNQRWLWQTMTGDEWKYLIKKRPNASKLQGTATVNGIHGLIILPDGWRTPSGLKWTGSPAKDDNWKSDWKTNKYSATQWAIMERNGAVFLPCVGCGVGNDFGSFNNGGAYWSASCRFNGAYYEGDCIMIGDIIIFGDYSQFRLAVRLIKDISGTSVDSQQ
jgi:hypothetical protein